MCVCLCVLTHVFLYLCVCSCASIFLVLVCKAFSLDVCVYTPGLPSVTHSDIDLCMASVCAHACACALAHIPAIIGIQISSQPRSKQHDGGGEQAQTDGSHCTHSNKQMEVI